MASFQNACNFMLVNEGGYSNHPLDNGGPTKYGITIKTLMVYRNRGVSIDEVEKLTEDEARAIYKKYYWDIICGEHINSQPMANMLFDQAVNRGARAAIKTLQTILFIKSDGIMGTETLAMLNKTQCGIRYFKACQLAYVAIAQSNPSQIVFLKGWLARSHTYLEDSV